MVHNLVKRFASILSWNTQCANDVPLPTNQKLNVLRVGCRIYNIIWSLRLSNFKLSEWTNDFALMRVYISCVFMYNVGTIFPSLVHSLAFLINRIGSTVLFHFQFDFVVFMYSIFHPLFLNFAIDARGRLPHCVAHHHFYSNKIYIPNPYSKLLYSVGCSSRIGRIYIYIYIFIYIENISRITNFP